MYTVQYSLDGGKSWAAATNCQSSLTSCEVDSLPAGTPVGFRVISGNEGGWGTPSEVALTKTLDSSASLACQNALLKELNGETTSQQVVVLITLAGVIGFVLLALLCFLVRRRRAPPPPAPPIK